MISPLYHDVYTYISKKEAIPFFSMMLFFSCLYYTADSARHNLFRGKLSNNLISLALLSERKMPRRRDRIKLAT